MARVTRPQSLDPQIEQVIALVEQAGYPDYADLNPQQARAQFEKTAPVLDLRPRPLWKVETIHFPVQSGLREARRYVPRVRGSTHPADAEPLLLWFHGGGFVVGSLQSYDSICRELAWRSQCQVLSFDYPLAPEHPFPAAVNDCEQAFDWVVDNAGRFGIDTRRIAIGGDSAGANLATVTSLARRKKSAPTPCFQLLVYPCTAAQPDSESHRLYGSGYLLTRRSIDWFYGHYLTCAEQRQDPRFAPLLAEDLRGMPPALIILAGFDPLYDEGYSYAQRLRAVGNRVEIADYPGAVHAFFSMAGSVDIAAQAIQRASAALFHAFYPDRAVPIE